MKNTVRTYLNRLRRDRTRQRKLAALLVCLSVMVAGGTIWSLHMNGESQTGEVYCGYSEEHQHTEDCIGEKVLICGYDTEGTTAAETEAPVHTHDESCYEEQTVLTCELEESAGHTHSEECYDADGNLICGMEESEGHTHSEENGCYTTEQALVCGLEEDAPETTEAVTETTREIPTHVHTDECYEITYICDYDYEHVHTLSCYSNPEADIETAEDWEKTVSNVELTGDFATDLVAIAKTQLGYAESSANYQVVLDDEGNETTETKGYTRYGAWYGMPYEDWCAMFVSFCLNYADITSEMVPYAASCPEWVESLSELGFYEPVYVEALDENGNTILVRNDYTPEKGDLVFFDWDDNGAANHVGIVEKLETKEVANSDGTTSYEYIVHTIEGNLAGQVAQKSYYLEDGTILGYSSIYSAYLTAVDTGKLEGIRHLTAETEDGASFSAIGQIPEGAVLEVSPLTEEQNAYLKENFGLTGSFYDIKIMLADGTEYQPEKAVQISVSGLGYDAHYTLTGYHLTDVSADTLMDVDAEDVTVEEVDVNNTGNRIGFGADGFSIYGVGTYAETAATFVESDNITQLTDVTALDGKTVIIADSTNTYAMSSTIFDTGTSSNFTAVSGWGIDNAIWTFEAVDASAGEYKIKNGSNYLYFNSAGRLKSSSSSLSGDYDNTFTVPTGDNGTFNIYGTVTHNNTTYSGYIATATDSSTGSTYFGRVESATSALNLYMVTGAFDVNSMTLWLHTATYDNSITSKTTIHYSTTTVAYYDGGTGTNHYATLSNAKVYYDTEGNTTYLIPISYLEQAFNFTFNSAEADTYPIVYVPSAFDANLTTSKGAVTPTYVSLTDDDGNETWYIQVTDTTGAATPRSNIYWINATEATDTVTPASTVMNVFDYWVTEGVVNDYNDGNHESGGINTDHTLKFTTGASGINAWTGNASPNTGIVQNTLGSDGYPALSSTKTGSDESLAYLFDPSVTATGKISYANVGKLLTVNSDGYYYYNSQERFATLDTESGNFIEYTTPAVSAGGSSPYGQFFPFNTIAEGALNNSLADYMNHYFGVSLTTRFLQQFDGYTTSGGTEPTTFAFTGDDDVWIFIDDVLVADLGGIHDAASVVINFVTGEVSINGTVTSNLKTLFSNAGVTINASDWNGNTFANSSTKAHTLKFYYLERGNTDSNMLLKYNLNDIPATGLFKVDQYGEALSGATFAVYASNESGQYLSNLDGAVVDLTSDTNAGWYVNLDTTSDDYGSIMSANGSVLVKALYCGTTDATGEMYFTDKDGMPLPISDLQSMFGTYFLLREVDVPDGYRTVSDDVLLKIENDLLQTAESSYLTGVWSSPNALVTATNTLYLADSSDSDKVNATSGVITYYTPANGNDPGGAHGSLFAVVLYKGTQGTDFDTWTPVSGSDVEGYNYIRTKSDNYSNVADAITAAKTYGTSHVFSYAASGMQVLIEELPGEITDYYTILANEDGDTTQAKYLVAYYYTTADSLDGATAENTARVTSHALVDGTDTPFTVQWGATIEVPNTVNVLYFQKADSDGDLLDNAVFALYEAATNNNIGYYKGTDSESSTVYIRLDEDASGNTAYGSAVVYNSSFTEPVTGTYTIQSGSTQSGGYITDSGAGTITVTVTDEEGASTTYTITPATNASNQSLVGYTHDVCSTVSEAGTGHFQYLNIGTYFLKEIQAPAGYTLGYVNVPVEVTNETVYANAGSAGNGVRVGNGMGYLVKTMDVFASLESIDETLSWIYTHLKVEFEKNSTGDFETDIDSIFQTYGGWAGTGFDGYGVPNSAKKGTSYIPASALADTKTWAGKDDTDTAMTQYLRYEGDLTTTEDTNSIFDYALYDRGEDYAAGAQSYRLWTDVGWSDLVIFQDYAYGNENKATYTQYTNLSGDVGIEEISYLFSSSTFVQVEDAVDVDLTVTKVTTDFDMTNSDGTTSTVTTYLDGAEFYLKEESSGLYYKYDANADPSTTWVTMDENPTKLTTETWFTPTGSTEAVPVTTKVSVENGVVTKTYTIGGTAYTLTSYENTGAATFTADDGTTLSGTLQRSFFKIYNLTEGTYTLTEVTAPTYSYTVGGGTTEEKFILDENNSKTTIELSSGSYWYYITTGTGNTIIVPQGDLGKEYYEVTEGNSTLLIPKTFKYRTEDGTVVDATVTSSTKNGDGGYTFTYTYNGTVATNTLYLNNTSGFTLEVSGGGTTRVFKVDNSGTTAAYWDSTTTAYQGGFRVMNTSEASDATLTLVKVDATADASATSTAAGYNTDKTQFAVTDGENLITHNILTGAKFYLYYTTAGDDTDKYYYGYDENENVQWSNNLEDAEKVSVDENGSLTFRSLNKSNTYYLVECQAPDGYSLLTEELEVKWDASGNLTVTGTSGTEYHLETIKDEDKNTSTTYLVVYNTGGYALPKTGGAGSYMFTLGGIAILAVVTLVYGCGLRRRHERRAE